MREGSYNGNPCEQREQTVREANTAFVSAALLTVFVVVIYLLLPSNTLAFALGIPAGALSGFLITLGVYFLQQPSFSIRVAEDKVQPKSGPWFFLHVLVEEQRSRVLGRRRGDGLPRSTDREEPILHTQVGESSGTAVLALGSNRAGTVTAVPWLDWSKMEESKVEVLGPGTSDPSTPW